jgi:hypothetical protein
MNRNKLLMCAALVAIAARSANSGQLEIVSMTTVTNSHDNTKPFVAARPIEGAYLAWAQKEGNRTAVLFAATQDGKRFSDPVRVSAPGMDLDLGAESGPNVAVDGGGTIYVVWSAGKWATSTGQTVSNTPAAPKKDSTADAAAKSPHAEHGSHATGKGAPMRPGNLSIFLARSNDDGRTFSDPIKVNDDPDGPEHRFPTVATGAPGEVYVAWLDKRPSASAASSCNVYVSRSHDHGETFSANVNATAGQVNSICHCCRVALATMAGQLFVAFRNDRDDLRDNFLVNSTIALEPFSSPIPIEDTGWYVPMCPFNGPSLTPDKSFNLHAVWMTGGEVAADPLVSGNSLVDYKVLYRHLEANNGAWGPIRYVAQGEHPRLAVLSNSTPAIAWDRGGIVSLIVLEATVTVDLKLSANGAFPSLAADSSSDELFVAWQDRLEGGPVQIKFARVKSNAATTN